MSAQDRLARLRKSITHDTDAAESQPIVPASVVEEAAAEATLQEPPTSQPTVDRSRMGWVSPAYTTSRSINLLPDVVTANRGIAFADDPATVDAYKILRTQILQRMQQIGGNTLMVTSALQGEGKTTTAINLAFTLAKEFQQTVLLIDCDLQKQQVHRYLGYESPSGLIDYLLDDCPVSELITWPGIEKMTVISGGRTIRESSELLGSPRMRELLVDMKSRYPDRFLICDVPAILTGADALVFAPLVDHALVVVQEGRTPLPDVRRTLATLPQGKVLGLMLNRHRHG